MLFFFSRLSFLLALLLFRQLSLMKASQKFPTLQGHASCRTMEIELCAPPCIFVEYNSLDLSKFASFLCLYDLVSVRQEFNIGGHFTARYADSFAPHTQHARNL
jgi:hypothetical protein